MLFSQMYIIVPEGEKKRWFLSRGVGRAYENIGHEGHPIGPILFLGELSLMQWTAERLYSE